MLRLLIYLIPVALAVFALVDCIQTPDESVRGLPKIGWILLIVLIWIVGPVTWLIAGRQRGPGRRGVPWPAGPTAGYPEYERPHRQLAPDDDPEFLSQLGRSNQEHERLLEQWEQDLRRREGDLRGDRPDDDGDDPGSTSTRS